jgi:hypothetical protein
MSCLSKRAVGVVAAAALGGFTPTAAADEPPSVRRLGSDVFMTGDAVHLGEDVPGDAVLMGSSILLDAPVHGDGLVAGREVELRGPIEADLYAAGRRIVLENTIGGNARILGAEVSVGPDAAIAGGVSIAAGRAEITGNVGGYLQVVAFDTTVSGQVAGDVDVSGEQLQLTPSAEVDGDVLFTGPQPAVVAPGARVQGEVRHVPSGESDAVRPWSSATLALGIFAVIGMATTGAVLWGLCPNITRSAIETATRRTGRAFLAGLAVAAATPLIIAMLVISIVGIPLAVLLAAAYVLLFPLGYLLVAACVARQLARWHPAFEPRSAAKRLVALSASLGLIAVLAALPVIGPLCTATLTLLGAGALALAGYEEHQRGRRSDAPGESIVGAAPAPAAGISNPA